jgi:hypothetical protein
LIFLPVCRHVVFEFHAIVFISFAGKMKTISDDEFASYLIRAKQKMAAPGSTVDPLSQVIVADKGKGTKRGRRDEVAAASNKAARLEDDLEILGEQDGDDTQEHRPPPVAKGGRSTRSRTATQASPPKSKGEMVEPATADGESSRREPVPAWNEDFDPVAFVADNLKGCTSRLDAMSLEELRKLAAGTGLKCLALN